MKRIVIAFAVVALQVSLVTGQEMRNNAPEVRRQLEQIKIWQMTKEMDLPTGKAEKFFPLYNDYTTKLKGVTADRRDAIRNLDTAVDNQLSDAQIQKGIQKIMDLDYQLADIHAKFLQSLGGILSPVEIARYLVFEQKFDREIRDRIRVMLRQRMRGPER
ncbi:MAG TPA: hypothetical protein VIS48_09030 [Candidatus Kryptonia bacterium]